VSVGLDARYSLPAMRLHAWGTVASVLLCVAVARAQSQSDTGGVESAQPAPDLRGQALQHFNQGTSLFERGEFSAALAEFEEAFRLYPTRASMKNQALCLERLGRYDEALSVLEALPARFPTLTDKERADYTLKLAELSKQVGSIELRGIEPGWEVSIDGRMRGTTPLASALRLNSGAHRLHLSRPGAPPVDETFAIQAGQVSIFQFRTEREFSIEREPRAQLGFEAPPQAPPAVSEPSRVRLGVEAGPLLLPTLGGDATKCPGDCERGLGWGGKLTVHLGYALSREWELWVLGGYLRVIQHVDDRPIQASPNFAGKASEVLTLSGLVLGGRIDYAPRALGGFSLRWGSGALLVAVHDERDATFSQAYSVEQVQRVRADYVYASLGAAFSVRLSSNVRLGAGVDVIGMYALRQPVWDEKEPFEVDSDSDESKHFARETLAGDTGVLLSPFLHLRYDF
jgi:hypothetical protein